MQWLTPDETLTAAAAHSRTNSKTSRKISKNPTLLFFEDDVNNLAHESCKIVKLNSNYQVAGKVSTIINGSMPVANLKKIKKERSFKIVNENKQLQINQTSSKQIESSKQLPLTSIISMPFKKTNIKPNVTLDQQLNNHFGVDDDLLLSKQV